MFYWLFAAPLVEHQLHTPNAAFGVAALLAGMQWQEIEAWIRLELCSEAVRQVCCSDPLNRCHPPRDRGRPPLKQRIRCQTERRIRCLEERRIPLSPLYEVIC